MKALFLAGLLLLSMGVPAKPVQFERSSYSATVSDAVLRGERQEYTFRARAGQRITINVQSVEQNAVFDLTGPKSLALSETTNWAGVAPKTGTYTVAVGATRGNANYRMNVAIH